MRKFDPNAFNPMAEIVREWRLKSKHPERDFPYRILLKLKGTSYTMHDQLMAQFILTELRDIPPEHPVHSLVMMLLAELDFYQKLTRARIQSRHRKAIRKGWLKPAKKAK